MDIEGNTYERAAIEEWIKKDGTSPITRNPISISDLGYNRVLKCAIAEEVARAQSAGEKKGTKPLDAALPVMPDDIMDLSAAIEDITLDEIRPVQEGLIQVQSYEGFVISDVAVFIFTGGQNRLVMLQQGRGARSVPMDSVVWSDGTILNGAQRITYRDLGQHIGLQNLRRFVWNGTTAVYTASTRDVINTRHKYGPNKIRITTTTEIRASLSDADNGSIQFEAPMKSLVTAVLDLLGEITSTTRWECAVAGSRWVPYDARIQRTIKRAKKELQATVNVCVKSVPYELNLVDMKQRRIDGKFNTIREIRRVSGAAEYCS